MGINIDHHAQAVVVLDANGSIVSFTSSGGTSATDDAAFTAGSSSVTPVGGIVTSDSVDSGDVGAFAMLANRQQKNTLYSSAGAEITAWPVTNAGTFVVQENGAALTSLQLLDDVVYAEDLAANSADKGVFVLAVAQGSNASATAANGDYIGIATDSNGRLRVTGPSDQDDTVAGGPVLVGGRASAAAPADVSADGDAVRSWHLRNGAQVVNLSAAGTLIPSGSGNATGALRVELANNGTGKLSTVSTVTTVSTLTGTTTLTPGTGATNLGKAEDAAHTTGDVGVMMLGVRQTSPTDMSTNNANGDYEPIQVNRDGAQWVVGAAGPTGGWSVATGSIAATKTDIGSANTAGQVGGWYIYNANASVAYVQFFNTQASGVTLGTTAPVYSLGIPAGGAANVEPGMVGLAHSTAICIAVTTTRAGSTGPGSTVDYNIWYKQ